jgi:hypothetical protein
MLLQPFFTFALGLTDVALIFRQPRSFVSILAMPQKTECLAEGSRTKLAFHFVPVTFIEVHDEMK